MKALLGMLVFCMVQLSWAEEPEAGAADASYTVQQGDTLGSLARSKLDVPGRWRDVARYNQLPDPDRIKPGQVLRIKPLWLKAESGVLKVGR